MNVRQKIQALLIALVTFLCFSTYHSGTGSTVWLQWLTFLSMLLFMFVFDLSFTSQSMFIFDPDADNWRRKTVGFDNVGVIAGLCRMECSDIRLGSGARRGWM